MADRYLITGASGLLGSNAVLGLSARGYDTLGLYCRHPVQLSKQRLIRCDLQDTISVRKLFEEFRPTVVLHCAALTQVDYCEDHPEETYRTNRDVSRDLALLSKEFKSKMVYISTDALYGEGTLRHLECEVPVCSNLYARSKWEGERAVQECLNESIILRTNIYGWNAQKKQSLAEWMLQALENQMPLTLFHDVIYSPILVNDLVDVVVELIQKGTSGVFNVGAHEPLSKLEFGKQIAGVFGLSGHCIQSISIDEKGLRSARTKNLGLDVKAVEQALGRPMPLAIEGIKRFKDLREDGYLRTLRATS